MSDHDQEGCMQVLEELARFLDGECGDQIEQAIHHHLGDCPPCLDRADFERELRALIASRCRDAAPSGLLDRVLDNLRSPAPESR